MAIGAMEMGKLGIRALLALLLAAPIARAHCPLCTAAIVGAAGGAAVLGVSYSVIGLFVGAFAVSTGWWVARAVKRRVVPMQEQALVAASFLLTVLPLAPFMPSVEALNVFWFGPYGSLFNATYVYDSFLAASVLGGAIVAVAPALSARVAEVRGGRRVPYQGVLLTLALLVLAGVALQFSI